jgi:hypothetical protein
MLDRSDNSSRAHDLPHENLNTGRPRWLPFTLAISTPPLTGARDIPRGLFHLAQAAIAFAFMLAIM